jgi:hypothetical protein
MDDIGDAAARRNEAGDLGGAMREGGMDRWQIPVSQRCFSRGSIHALRVEWEDDGSAIRWESMLQIDLVQNRKRGV